MGQSPSSGNTVILTTVGHFFTAVHLVALQNLPSALETAHLLTDNIFRLHRIPLDVVLDRGPQLTSCVWKEFCKALGAQVSLSSGFHFQTNRTNQELEDTSMYCLVRPYPLELPTLHS